MNLLTVQPSMLHIRQIPCYTTRRTSHALFNGSLDFVLGAVENLVDQHVPLDEPAIRRHLNNVRFGFYKVHQRIQRRKFPMNVMELFAYLGVPIHQVSIDLGVGVATLRQRCLEASLEWPSLGGFWPEPSNQNGVLAAVQYCSPNAILNVKYARIGWDRTIGQVHRHLRFRFHVDTRYGRDAPTEIHVAVNGRRYGPVTTTDQWQEIIHHPYNQHRVSVIFVNMDPRAL